MNQSLTPKVGDTLEVSITDLSRGGAGIARLETGTVVFVPFSAVGDRALVEIVSTEKRYLNAKIHTLLESGPDRIEPRCQVFGKCGGCDWQHLPYRIQFERKKSGVLHALERSGVEVASHCEVDTFPSDQPWNYRNRIQLRGGQGKIGFHARGSNDIVEIERCEIAMEPLNQRLSQRRAIQFPLEPFKWEMTVSVDGKTVQDTWNRPHGALGFRQVNDEMNAKLQSWVSTHAGEGDHLIDLFGGSGNLSLPLLDHFSRIDCVDVWVPRDNPAPHFRYTKGDAIWWLRDHIRSFEKDSKRTLLIDPPREGVGKRMPLLKKALVRTEVETIIAIGCDADSFARDLKGYLRLGYRLDRLAVFDLFPQTHHVEAAAVLKSTN